MYMWMRDAGYTRVLEVSYFGRGMPVSLTLCVCIISTGLYCNHKKSFPPPLLQIQ